MVVLLGNEYFQKNNGENKKLRRKGRSFLQVSRLVFQFAVSLQACFFEWPIKDEIDHFPE